MNKARATVSPPEADRHHGDSPLTRGQRPIEPLQRPLRSLGQRFSFADHCLKLVAVCLAGADSMVAKRLFIGTKPVMAKINMSCDDQVLICGVSGLVLAAN